MTTRGKSLHLIAALMFCSGILLNYSAFAENRPAQSIKPAGTTLNLAQSLDWIDDGRFAIGRWDGTIAVFRRPNANEYGPVVLEAMAAPSGAGIEMLAAVNEDTMVTSDGRDRLAVWRRRGAAYTVAGLHSYDATYGPANSGVALKIDSTKYFVSGHEAGYILIWQWKDANLLELTRVVDVRSRTAPSNPWGIHNVRGLKTWRGDHVIAGSEDGDLVGIKVPSGAEVFRVRYNDKAQRGINNISVAGDWILVANCAVGSSDKNIWVFNLASGEPVLSDAENLTLDLQRAQVFNFDAELVLTAAGVFNFFASTEEGLLWQGSLEGGQLIVTGVTRIAPEGAAILALAPNTEFLAVVANSVRLFRPG